MIYLENNKKNTLYVTFTEGGLSGNTEWLFKFRSDSTNAEFYCIVSASTSNYRYDEIEVTLTGSTDYFYSMPLLDSGFYYYKAYELLTGVTTGITTTMLSANTIDISTACTSTVIVEQGKINVDGASQSVITNEYNEGTNTYKYYN